MNNVIITFSIVVVFNFVCLLVIAIHDFLRMIFVFAPFAALRHMVDDILNARYIV